jgi:hypothetical protein
MQAPPEPMQLPPGRKHARHHLKQGSCNNSALTGQTGHHLSYGPPWAHYLGGYQDRLLGGPLGLPSLRYTAPEGVEHKDYTGIVLS